MKNVKLICSAMTGQTDLFDTFRDFLEKEFGPVDLESDIFPFDYTDYYEKEMGPDLSKKIYSFENPIDQGAISDIKLRTIQMEKDLAKSLGTGIGRVVNLDPGYVGTLKLVLATTKDRGHRIYLQRGIYAEVTLQYIKGSFQHLPSTYPDHRNPEYKKFFNQVRERGHSLQVF